MNEFVVSLNKKKYSIKISEDGHAEINGRTVLVDLSQINNSAFLLKVDEKPYEIASNKLENGRYGFLLDGWYFDTMVRTKLQEHASELMRNKMRESHKAEFKAPMPGLVLKIIKQKGASVSIGDPLIILEAMKMENELRSTASGIITGVNVKEGDSVEKGVIIMTIEQ
ncbi:MAG: biotin/lipoyl-containing protein [Melioribacteraceae bacterium]|nr:biotin/lipoyl-containing protein [Melioribacteraceae bacterium]